LEEEDSSAYRKGVNALATRLASIAAEPVVVTPGAIGGAYEAVDTPGLLETMVAAEEAMERVPRLLEHVTELMETVNVAVGEATAQASGATGGKVFAARLAAAHRLATAIREPAAEFKATASEYANDMVALDAGVLTLIRQIEAGDLEGEEVAGFLGSIRELAGVMDDVSGNIDEFLRVLPETAALSRELRAPIGDLQEGSLRMSDGTAIVLEWRRRIKGLDAPT
jgi:hypothetical protein